MSWKWTVVSSMLQRNFYLWIPREEIARPQSQFPHSWVPARSSTYFPAAEQADRSWEYIHVYKSLMNVGIWDWDRAVPYLGIFVSNFRYCVFAGHFTQLVWKSSTRLGVGRARGRNFDYVVAVYSPPGTDSPKQPYLFDNNVRQKM
jgi:hypothetical protein